MGIKIKRETTTSRKNALGRKVVVNRNASGNEAVSKTRTVYSKNGGLISEKKSYKDRESVAGKMLQNKISKQMYGTKKADNVVQRIKQDAKPIMQKRIKEGPVRPIGNTVKRVKEGPVKRIKG